MSEFVVYALSFAGVVTLVASLWYLFQTVKIMWSYNSLLAITAVIFSPIVHMVFYFMPKDEFDNYEKSMFKKYFLSIMTTVVLGIFTAIAIPSFKDSNQDTEVSDIDAGQPWDWDIRAENQEEALALADDDATSEKAAELHFKAIYQAHPDADKIMESSDFNEWLQGQSAEKKDDIERVLREGTAIEVIYVFSNFKQDLSNYRSYEYQAKRDNAQAIAERGYQEKQSRNIEATKSNNQKYYEDEGHKQISEYVTANRIQPPSVVQEALVASKPSHSIPVPSAVSTPSQIVNCDGAGCWDTNGTRYNKGAGDTYFPSTGGSCQNIGGQMQCN